MIRSHSNSCKYVLLIYCRLPPLATSLVIGWTLPTHLRAAISALESAVAIVYKKPPTALSAQIIVDCANPSVIAGPQFSNDDGCSSGDSADAVRFTSQFSIPAVSGASSLSWGLGRGASRLCRRNRGCCCCDSCTRTPTLLYYLPVCTPCVMCNVHRFNRCVSCSTFVVPISCNFRNPPILT